MARPRCPRHVHDLPPCVYFKPQGVPMSELDEILLSVDEFEALRLADQRGLYQEQAARKMKVSRATFGRIIGSARQKVADALVTGQALRIEGGDFKLAELRRFQCQDCSRTWQLPFGGGRPKKCPSCGSDRFRRLDRGQRETANASGPPRPGKD